MVFSSLPPSDHQPNKRVNNGRILHRISDANNLISLNHQDTIKNYRLESYGENHETFRLIDPKSLVCHASMSASRNV